MHPGRDPNNTGVPVRGYDGVPAREGYLVTFTSLQEIPHAHAFSQSYPTFPYVRDGVVVEIPDPRAVVLVNLGHRTTFNPTAHTDALRAAVQVYNRGEIPTGPVCCAVLRGFLYDTTADELHHLLHPIKERVTRLGMFVKNETHFDGSFVIEVMADAEAALRSLHELYIRSRYVEVLDPHATAVFLRHRRLQRPPSRTPSHDVRESSSMSYPNMLAPPMPILREASVMDVQPSQLPVPVTGSYVIPAVSAHLQHQSPSLAGHVVLHFYGHPSIPLLEAHLRPFFVDLAVSRILPVPAPWGRPGELLVEFEREEDATVALQRTNGVQVRCQDGRTAQLGIFLATMDEMNFLCSPSRHPSQLQ